MTLLQTEFWEKGETIGLKIIMKKLNFKMEDVVTQQWVSWFSFLKNDYSVSKLKSPVHEEVF